MYVLECVLGSLLGLGLLWLFSGIFGLALLYLTVFIHADNGKRWSDISENLRDPEFNQIAISLGPLAALAGLVFLGIFLYAKYDTWRDRIPVAADK